MNENMYYSGNKGIKLFPTPEQAQFIDMCLEGYMIVYNWALSKEYEQYDLFINGKTDRSFLSYIDIQNMYPQFRAGHELLSKLPTHSMLNAVKDMVKGYESFFKNKDIFNKPNFKTSMSLYSSYKPRSEPTSFYFQDNMLRIEGLPYQNMIVTSFHTGNYLIDGIKYINPTIHRNNRTKEYTVSYVVEKEKLCNYFQDNNIPKSEPIGVDVNKNIMYACSNGLNIYSVDTTRIQNHIASIDKQIQNDRDRYNESLKINPNSLLSNSALERLNKRKKLYERLSNIHKDTAYKGSLEIIRLNPEAVILEDLDIKKLMSYKYIADDLSTHSLGIAQNILEQQCFKYGIPVYYAPRFFESSNYCSNCNSYRNIGSNPIFNCKICGLKMQRDTNAAINLKNWYLNNR